MAFTAPSCSVSRTEWGKKTEERYLPTIQSQLENAVGEPLQFAGRIDKKVGRTHVFQPFFVSDSATFTAFMYSDPHRARSTKAYLVSRTEGGFRYQLVDASNVEDRVARVGALAHPYVVLPALKKLEPEFTLLGDSYPRVDSMPVIDDLAAKLRESVQVPARDLL